MVTIKWEEINHEHAEALYRAKVPGGWLLKEVSNVLTATPDGYANSWDNKAGWQWRSTITFVPDPNHDWK